MRSISQRVAPSASAASFSATGATAKTSRQIAVTIGSTMIASTMPADEVRGPEERARERRRRSAGTPPSQLERSSAIGWIAGMSAKMPQKP